MSGRPCWKRPRRVSGGRFLTWAARRLCKANCAQQGRCSFRILDLRDHYGLLSTIAVGRNDRAWQALIRAVNRPEWAEDPGS